MIRYFTILCVLISIPQIAVFAQTVELNEDPSVQNLMQQFVDNNRANPGVEGWRVQILSTTDRSQLESVRQSIRSRYPYLTTNWVHNRPYYRLLAGAFTSKLEALRLQHLLRSYYPGSVPTRDTDIDPSEIIGN